jgi:hypothetical protein
VNASFGCQEETIPDSLGFYINIGLLSQENKEQKKKTTKRKAIP